MMTKADFTKELVKYLEEHDRVESVTQKEVQKVNGVTKSAIIPKVKNSNVSPSIYIDTWYDTYKEGNSLSAIFSRVDKLLKENPERYSVAFKDFESIKNLIYPRLISKERNKELLKKIPHREYLDLAIVYHLRVYSPNKQLEGNALIEDGLMNFWGTSEQELYEIAVNNLEKEPPKFDDLGNMLSGLLTTPIPSGASTMYVISNIECSFGAIEVLNKDLMDKIHNMLGDFYVIPSSVHEVIVLSKNSNEDFNNTMVSIIKDVNRHVVDPMEVLSDSLYVYNGILKVAK